MTRDEIIVCFRRYSGNVTEPETFGSTKQDAFMHCVRCLSIEDQYRSLVDLCRTPPVGRNSLPAEQERRQLLEYLIAHGAANGVVIHARDVLEASLDWWDVFLEWVQAASRLEESPRSAITSSRTALERACREVLTAVRPDERQPTDGDLGKLVRLARQALDLPVGADRIATAIGSLAVAVAESSNVAGDRHAPLVPTPASVSEARLSFNVCFALALHLLDVLRTRQPVT